VLIFPLYFQLHYLREETCFQQAGSSAVEGNLPVRLNQDLLSDQQKEGTCQSVIISKK
jgi:hypothetical protein